MTNILEFALRSNRDAVTEEFAQRCYDAACKLEVAIRQVENLSWLLSIKPPSNIIEEAGSLIAIMKDISISGLKRDFLSSSFERRVSYFADQVASWISNDMLPTIPLRTETSSKSSNNI